MPPLSRALRASLSILLATYSIAAKPAAAEEDDDLLVIELSAFEVFSKSIKLVDGMTGKEYKGNNPIALGFRREFDDVLLRFHKTLLTVEYHKLKARDASIQPHISDLSALAASFGWEGFEVKGPHLTREFAIFHRMAKDPFFKIEKIVVWNTHALAEKGNTLPNNRYARNIRLNETTGKWERRVLTEWQVSYIRENPRTGKTNNFSTYKEQGLNLDTNRGFHLIDRGLPSDIPPHAFKEVGLDYPILIDDSIDVNEEIENLKRGLVENLIYLYDPFSWVARGNTRFRGGFNGQLREHLRKQRINISDRDWFDSLFSQFLDDVVTIKYWGADEIYEHRILSSIPKNRNQLGQDLDLLNWQKNEKRTVNYDPSKPIRAPRINFDGAGAARFIMIDAYRRYGDKFLDALRTRILNIEEKADPRQLILNALEEATGIPSEKYLPLAAKAQKTELQRFIPKP